MNKWNRTGKIKAAIILITAASGTMARIRENNEVQLQFIILPFIFGVVMVFLMSLLSNNKTPVVAPNWNENPLSKSSSRLVFIQFSAWFFLLNGLGMLIGAGVRMSYLSVNGITCVCFALGLLFGIYLSLKWLKSKV